MLQHYLGKLKSSPVKRYSIFKLEVMQNHLIKLYKQYLKSNQIKWSNHLFAQKYQLLTVQDGGKKRGHFISPLVTSSDLPRFGITCMRFAGFVAELRPQTHFMHFGLSKRISWQQFSRLRAMQSETTQFWWLVNWKILQCIFPNFFHEASYV